MKAEIYGRWWASVSLKHRANSEAYILNQDTIQKKWDQKWGDRMNELVFIGKDMDKEKISAELDKCLLMDFEIMGMDSGNQFTDEWPI